MNKRTPKSKALLALAEGPLAGAEVALIVLRSLLTCKTASSRARRQVGVGIWNAVAGTSLLWILFLLIWKFIH